MLKKHLPGLDGIRAIAAIIVIIFHVDQLSNNFSLNMHEYISTFDTQAYAVTIFFVLSGFLITLLLLVEKRQNVKIDFKKFYMRRILKIWPLYFLIIAIVFSISFFYPNNYWMNKEESNYLYYVFFIGNIAYLTNHTIQPLIPFWSIAVEEQFYLIWPFIVKPQNVLKSLLIFLLLFFFLKILLRLIDRNIAYWLVETRFSCMTIGGLGAYLYITNSILLKYIYSKYFQFISWIILISLIFYKPINVISNFNHEFYSFFFIILILNISTNENNIFTINGKLFEYLGKISYGLYCWHLIIILLISKKIYTLNLKDTFINKFAIQILVLFTTILISHISYYFFELKFLKLKNKFIS